MEESRFIVYTLLTLSLVSSNGDQIRNSSIQQEPPFSSILNKTNLKSSSSENLTKIYDISESNQNENPSKDLDNILHTVPFNNIKIFKKLTLANPHIRHQYFLELVKEFAKIENISLQNIRETSCNNTTTTNGRVKFPILHESEYDYERGGLFGGSRLKDLIASQNQESEDKIKILESNSQFKIPILRNIPSRKFTLKLKSRNHNKSEENRPRNISLPDLITSDFQRREGEPLQRRRHRGPRIVHPSSGPMGISPKINRPVFSSQGAPIYPWMVNPDLAHTESKHPIRGVPLYDAIAEEEYEEEDEDEDHDLKQFKKQQQELLVNYYKQKNKKTRDRNRKKKKKKQHQRLVPLMHQIEYEEDSESDFESSNPYSPVQYDQGSKPFKGYSEFDSGSPIQTETYEFPSQRPTSFPTHSYTEYMTDEVFDTDQGSNQNWGSIDDWIVKAKSFIHKMASGTYKPDSKTRKVLELSIGFLAFLAFGGYIAALIFQNIAPSLIFPLFPGLFNVNVTNNGVFGLLFGRSFNGVESMILLPRFDLDNLDRSVKTAIDKGKDQFEELLKDDKLNIKNENT